MPTNPRYQWTPSTEGSQAVNYSTWTEVLNYNTAAQQTSAANQPLLSPNAQAHFANLLSEAMRIQDEAQNRMNRDREVYESYPLVRPRRSRTEMYADVEAEDL